ncbi:MAG: response regulator [bacterium]
MKRKILIVDDEVTTVQLIEFILEKNEFTACCAYSGLKAIQTAQQEKPDLILLDIMMPGLDGLEVCEKLKNDDQTKGIPIIFLTAMGQESDVARGIKLGAESYIVKPFNPESLLLQIEKILDKN